MSKTFASTVSDPNDLDKNLDVLISEYETARARVTALAKATPVGRAISHFGGEKQFASAIGVKLGTIRVWKSRGFVPMLYAHVIADALGCEVLEICKPVIKKRIAARGVVAAQESQADQAAQV